jgi:hypothetical protein
MLINIYGYYAHYIAHNDILMILTLRLFDEFLPMLPVTLKRLAALIR